MLTTPTPIIKPMGYLMSYDVSDGPIVQIHGSLAIKKDSLKDTSGKLDLCILKKEVRGGKKCFRSLLGLTTFGVKVGVIEWFFNLQ